MDGRNPGLYCKWASKPNKTRGLKHKASFAGTSSTQPLQQLKQTATWTNQTKKAEPRAKANQEQKQTKAKLRPTSVHGVKGEAEEWKLQSCFAPDKGLKPGRLWVCSHEGILEVCVVEIAELQGCGREAASRQDGLEIKQQADWNVHGKVPIVHVIQQRKWRFLPVCLIFFFLLLWKRK